MNCCGDDIVSKEKGNIVEKEKSQSLVHSKSNITSYSRWSRSFPNPLLMNATCLYGTSNLRSCISFYENRKIN